jgi:hypothetical protein
MTLHGGLALDGVVTERGAAHRAFGMTS